jgi:hypothetical protein
MTKAPLVSRGPHVNRRQAVRLLGGAGAAMWCGAGTTQAAGKRPLVVYFSTGREGPAAFLDGMRGLGYVAGVRHRLPICR